MVGILDTSENPAPPPHPTSPHPPCLQRDEVQRQVAATAKRAASILDKMLQVGPLQKPLYQRSRLVACLGCVVHSSRD